MKYIKYLLLSLGLFFVLIINCNASTKTFERTRENLLVPSDVMVTDEIVDSILKTPAIDSSEKVYDFAELLTDGEEKQLLKDIKSYTSNTNFELVVVTTKDLKGFTIGNYASNFYKYNSFSKDGVIFIISTATEKTSIYMANNGKAGNVYNSSLVSKTLEYVYSDIKDKKYSDALDDYVKILDRYYTKKQEEKDPVNSTSSGISTRDIILLCLALTFLVSMIVYYVLTQKKLKKSKSVKVVNKSANEISTTPVVEEVKTEPVEVSTTPMVEEISTEPPVDSGSEK